MCCRATNLIEIGRLTGKTAAMNWVSAISTPEEVGCVAHKRASRLDRRDSSLRWADQQRRCAGCGSVLKRITRLALGGICADRQCVLGHAAANHTHASGQRLGAGLASELPISRADQPCRAERLGDDRAGGLD